MGNPGQVAERQQRHWQARPRFITGNGDDAGITCRQQRLAEGGTVHSQLVVVMGLEAFHEDEVDRVSVAKDAI